MKLFISTILLFLSVACFSIGPRKVYFSSSTGNDGNPGTQAQPYETISKLNTFLAGAIPGDSIFLKSGDTFYGSIIPTKSGLAGQELVLTSYGSGAKPIITGLTTITGWVDLGGNVWEAPTSGVKPLNNLVLRNGVIMQVGRYPNANAANGGYLTYTASSTTSITGSALSTTTNWTGAEVAVRSARWEIRRRRVTSHSGGTVGFAGIGTTPKIGYGYFFQRDSRTLDQDGEWFQNGTTNKLRMYFANDNPNAYTIQAATVDTLFNNRKSQIKVIGLAFNGAGKWGMNLPGSVGCTIKDCDVTNSGGEGITVWFGSNDIVDHCTTNNCLGNGIKVYGYETATANLTVQDCSINNTSLIAGMELTDTSSGNGIFVRGGYNVNVLRNVIKNSGYNGIYWQGQNVYIKYNYIDSFCSVRDDGGGIYTFTKQGNAVVYGTNRNIISNTITNGIGAMYGAPMTDLSPNGLLSRRSVSGIYFDEGTRDVVADSNTIANVPLHGFQGNGNSNLTLRYNTVYNAGYSHAFQRLRDENIIDSFIVKKNIFYPYRFRLRDQASNLPTTASKEAIVIRFGFQDSNYYSLRPGTDTSLNVQTEQNPTFSGSYSEYFKSFTYLTSIIEVETVSISSTYGGIIVTNPSANVLVYAFNGFSKKDPKGTVYNNSVSIPAYSSVILINNGTVSQPPVANAGSDQVITLPNDTAFISGVASTDDGTITNYGWVKVSGPGSGTISCPSSAVCSVNGLVEGVYKYELTVTDNFGATAKDTMQITVNAEPSALNLSPSVSAGSDLSVTAPIDTVNLVSTASDPDGIIVSYEWEQLTGASTTIDNANADVATVRGLTTGVYTFQITVTDDSSAIDRDTVQVTVNELPNISPEARAGIDQYITLPQSTVTLNGTDSYDTDGTIDTYEWTGADGTIVSANSATTDVTSLTEGEHIYTLTITDDQGAQSTDTITITVYPVPVPSQTHILLFIKVVP